ncbi:MAG: hypothetical protein V3T74_11580 [Gemmatimonadales bacterium]|jgi:hypothetical protein
MSADNKIDPAVERRLAALEARVIDLAEQMTQLAHNLATQMKLADEVAAIKYEGRENEL